MDSSRLRRNEVAVFLDNQSTALFAHRTSWGKKIENRHSYASLDKEEGDILLQRLSVHPYVLFTRLADWNNKEQRTLRLLCEAKQFFIHSANFYGRKVAGKHTKLDAQSPCLEILHDAGTDRVLFDVVANNVFHWKIPYMA